MYITSFAGSKGCFREIPRNTDRTQTGQGDSRRPNFTAEGESETSLSGLRRVYKEDDTSYSTYFSFLACTI